MRTDMINSKTGLLGLIGDPVEHSYSPLLHNQALQELGLNYVYLPLRINTEELEAGIKGLRALNIKGVNVTIPHKERVMPLLDEIDPLAARTGAVNTILNKQGKLFGYNTDVYGVDRLITEDGQTTIKGKKALVIGAGGAARAVGIALCQAAVAELYLFNRTVKKAEELARTWSTIYPDTQIVTGSLDADLKKSLMNEIDILIDTTPVGMYPEINAGPIIAWDFLHPGMLVIDLVYNPAETTLLKAASRAGARGLNGLAMLLYQGSESFRIWTGYQVNIDSWRFLVKNILKSQ